MGSWGREDSRQGGSWQTGWHGGWQSGQPHICIQNNCGARQTAQPRVPGLGNIASKPLTEKPVGVDAAGETPRLTGEVVGETHSILECKQNHSPGNQHHNDQPSLLVGSGGSDWKPVEAKQVALFLLRPLSHIQHHNAARWVVLPWHIPKAPPLTV